MTYSFSEEIAPVSTLYPKESSMLPIFSSNSSSSNSNTSKTTRTGSIFMDVEHQMLYQEEKGDPMAHNINCATALFLDIFDEFCFLFVDHSNVYIYTRQKLVVRKKRRTKVNSDSTAEQQQPPAKEKFYSDFTKARELNFFEWIAPYENSTSQPTQSFIRIGNDVFVFGFVNGSIKVVLCEFLSEDESKRKPRLICDFIAHHECTISSLSTLPWCSVLGSMYVTEFVTAGKDNKIFHWGVRSSSSSSSSSSSTDNSYCADQIGVYIIFIITTIIIIIIYIQLL
jgi:hypothetical protein